MNDPQKLDIKSDAEGRARSFLNEKGVINFPWEVLIATALHG